MDINNKEPVMNKLLIFILVLLANFGFAQNKHALLVGIGNYPKTDKYHNWRNLSSLNDMEIIEDMLTNQKFNSITKLVDAEATTENLKKNFEQIIDKVQKNDIVYFHFSGHGQQVEDVNGNKLKSKDSLLKKDEVDKRDESLALYNAPDKFYEGYEYQDHFVDDQLNYYCNRIRSKIGSKGNLIVVVDACHSGSVTRGNPEDEPIFRGSGIFCGPDNNKDFETKDDQEGFGTDFEYNKNADWANLIAFFGCKAEQVNREFTPSRNSTKSYGSLSYFLVQAMQQLGEKASYTNLYSEIRKNMILNFQNAQHPEIEGDNLNQVIFNDNFVAQEPFFQVVGDIFYNEVSIDAGFLSGLSVGDSIGLFNNTVSNAKETEPLYKGYLKEVGATESTLILNNPVTDKEKSGVQFRAFKIFSASNGLNVKVKLTLKSSKHKKLLKEKLEKVPNISINQKDYNYQVFEDEKGKLIIIMGSMGNLPLRNMSPITISDDSKYDSLITFIKEASKVDLFRTINSQDDNLDFEITLKDINGNIIDKSSALKFKDGDQFKIVVKNTGNEDFYLNSLIISSNNIVNMDPKSKASVLIKTGGERTYTIKGLSEPFGIEQVKFIATRNYINLNNLQSNGTEITTRDAIGETNPLLEFIKTTLEGTRSSGFGEDIGATIKSFEFEIKP